MEPKTRTILKAIFDPSDLSGADAAEQQEEIQNRSEIRNGVPWLLRSRTKTNAVICAITLLVGTAAAKFISELEPDSIAEETK